MNTRKPLGECAVGTDVILPMSGPATVIEGPQCGNVKVIVESERLGRVRCLRQKLTVIDTGSVSPNVGPQSDPKVIRLEEKLEENLRRYNLRLQS